MLVSANIFQPLIDVFQSVIQFFHDNIGLSWGWSIVLLTVCVRLVLMPLTVKQFQSMRRLQAHQPEMKAIQQKYKDDKQLQQQEMMKFYQENNVNPFASCLPLALQMPVFMALYFMLRKNLRDDICPNVQAAARTAYASKHNISVAAAHGHSVACSSYSHVAGYHKEISEASFLFLKDITTTATGVSLIVLLVLYVGTQVLSTWLMQQPGMDKNQQRMMMALPLVFVLFIIKFPAGLMVYWITTNLWTVGQGVVMKYWMGPPPPVAVQTGGGSSGVKIESSSDAGERGSSSKTKSGGLFAGMMARAAEQSAAKGSGGSKSAASTAKTQRGGRGSAPSGGVKAGGSTSGDASAGGPPPPSPRKKKKRSGRRR